MSIFRVHLSAEELLRFASALKTYAVADDTMLMITERSATTSLPGKAVLLFGDAGESSGSVRVEITRPPQ